MSKHTVKHIVGFSGGIDSQACARWVLNRFPKEDVILLNSDAGGNEHPLTTEFIDWYSANVHPVVKVYALVQDMWVTPGHAETKGFKSLDILTFPKLIQIKGRGPGPQSQFCTHFLKLQPTKKWIAENVTDEYVRYSGVRRDESSKRADTPYLEFDEEYDCDLYRPLMDWTKQMCFDYVKAHGEKINHLYTLGFNRVGCAPCVNSGKEDIRNWAQRFPAMIDKIRGWEQETKRTFFPPKVPGLRLNWVDEIVAWSMTERGGHQTTMEALIPPPSCQSKHGLCE
jgi:3'-phosphoadenosine 5'-phosphosulfate sulfotransferase (PAPS reductase)/FAD synthetase